MRQWIESSCKKNGNRYNVDDCLAEVESGLKKLWFVPQGVVITQIVDFPRMRVGVIDLCAGEKFSEWADELLQEIENYMRDEGCKQCLIIARKGFKKFFLKHGYKSNQLAFEKVL